MRVLIAQALSPKRRRITSLLAAAGHEVVAVSDPDAALERWRAWRPDVALVHTECCGELVAEIKSDPEAFATAIIMIVRPGLTPDEARAGMRAGVQDYLVEPLADGELLTRVEAAARTKDLQHELVAQGIRLESLLREDALTGLSNRRAILTQLAGQVSRARRHGHPLSIAMLDLDNFKRVNDTYGHTCGDEVLVAAVRAMRAHLRQEDQLGRLGGEEFLVLLPDTNGDAAVHVAEKLRVDVANAESPVAVTTSIGVATWEGEAADTLLRRADEALYAAKDAGRDRVVAATLHDRT